MLPIRTETIANTITPLFNHIANQTNTQKLKQQYYQFKITNNRFKSLDAKKFCTPEPSKATKLFQIPKPFELFTEREITDTTTESLSEISSIQLGRNNQYNTTDYSTIDHCNYSSNPIFRKKKIIRSSSSKTHLRSDSNPHEFEINLEDLMMLEQKLSDIIHSIKASCLISNFCFEWWNFYFNCSLNGNLEHYFLDKESKEIISFYTNIQLLSIMIIYDSSYDTKLFKLYLFNINNIMTLLHKSFLVICDYILSKVSKEFTKELWVDKLRKLLHSKHGYMISPIHIDDIRFNSNCAYEYIRLILTIPCIKNPKNSLLKTIYDGIKTHSNNDFNKIFLNSIFRVANPQGSVVASYILNQKSNVINVITPYLKTKCTMPYTLVLDLDETLISYKLNPVENQGLLRLRPGLYEFLDHVSQYYELVIFTAATREYADRLLNAIEAKKKYFAHRLYREHTLIIKNDFIKDITRIGRDISRTIIVDNMPQNFRLQKENGILILSFYGEDHADSALYDLGDILITIAKDDKDVRISLKKYKDDIIKYVSSKISQ